MGLGEYVFLQYRHHLFRGKMTEAGPYLFRYLPFPQVTSAFLAIWTQAWRRLVGAIQDANILQCALGGSVRGWGYPSAMLAQNTAKVTLLVTSCMATVFTHTVYCISLLCNLHAQQRLIYISNFIRFRVSFCWACIIFRWILITWLFFLKKNRG